MSSSSSSLPCAVAAYNPGNGNLETRLETRNLETRLETRLVQLETDKDSLRLQVIIIDHSKKQKVLPAV